jgi:hypothetical protein
MKRILLALIAAVGLTLLPAAPAAAQWGLANRYGYTFTYPGYVSPRYSYRYNYSPYGYNYSYRYSYPSYGYSYGYPSYRYAYPSYGYYRYPSYGYYGW